MTTNHKTAKMSGHSNWINAGNLMLPTDFGLLTIDSKWHRSEANIFHTGPYEIFQPINPVNIQLAPQIRLSERSPSYIEKIDRLQKSK